MGYRFIIILVFSLLLAACYAQPTAEFQSVSGDFARSWLNGFLEQNPKSAENKSGDLWSWGGVPKGYTLVDGKLVPIQNITISAGNSTVNWLGDVYIDPYTGEPVYGSQQASAEPDYGTNLPMVFNSNDPWA